KDHWAMYPCPQRIPVVYEPLGGIAMQPKPTAKPTTEEEILKSILIRGTPALITASGQQAPATMTAWERYQGQPHGNLQWQIFSHFLGYEGGPIQSEVLIGNNGIPENSVAVSPITTLPST